MFWMLILAGKSFDNIFSRSAGCLFMLVFFLCSSFNSGSSSASSLPCGPGTYACSLEGSFSTVFYKSLWILLELLPNSYEQKHTLKRWAARRRLTGFGLVIGPPYCQLLGQKARTIIPG